MDGYAIHASSPSFMNPNFVLTPLGDFGPIDSFTCYFQKKVLGVSYYLLYLQSSPGFIYIIICSVPSKYFCFFSCCTPCTWTPECYWHFLDGLKPRMAFARGRTALRHAGPSALCFEVASLHTSHLHKNHSLSTSASRNLCQISKSIFPT